MGELLPGEKGRWGACETHGHWKAHMIAEAVTIVDCGRSSAGFRFACGLERDRCYVGYSDVATTEKCSRCARKEAALKKGSK